MRLANPKPSFIPAARRTFVRLVFVGLVLVGQLPLVPAAAALAQNDGSGSYTGWALEAYPSMSAQDFVTTLTRLRDAGANLVWLGHSNPANVDPNANEVGLTYAAYAAAIDPADPQHASALAILAAQTRALDAARAVGLKVVFPINYRTQMGDTWNAGHSGSLRRGPDGAILNFGGEDASPYAGDFRSDTVRYYRWVDQNFVGPYRDVILMLNLADEPSGVDYSPASEAAFNATTGYNFGSVGSDVRRQTALGSFQSHVMVDFATWAARQWQEIDPAVTVTISFDGGPGRKNQQAPAIEAIFREAPTNLQPAWDAFPRDGTPIDPLNDGDLTALTTLLGTLGHYSARYGRHYWLWSSGNSWGLGQGSGDPSTIADAEVNLRMLADVSRQAGGLLRGVAVWNYNLRGQGLYNDSYHPSYNPDDLFSRVSAMLPDARQILNGPAGPGPDALLLAPNALPDREIGGTRLVDTWNYRGYNFEELVSLARSGATPAVVASLAGEDLSHVRLLAVLARDPADLSPDDVSILRAYRARGGTLVDSAGVDGAFQLRSQWVYPGNAPELFFSNLVTSSQAGPVAALGMPRLANSFALRGPGETIAYGGVTSDPSDQVHAWLTLSHPTSVVVYDQTGVPSSHGEAGPGLVAIPTARHTFSLLPSSPLILADTTESRFFPQTGFRVADDSIWDYFSRRGGVTTFGYPISRAFRFQGFTVQFFQRRIVQLDARGSPRLLNVLDPGLVPYDSFNAATIPAFDNAFVAAAPSVTDGAGTLSFVRAQTPNSGMNQSVNFGQTYWNTVPSAAALPNGGNPGLLPGFDLEMWGIPTSAPTLDPNNHAVVYQRFQRGVMMYDASCGCTQGLLLADYLKSILTGNNLPADLAREATTSPLFRQYDPSQPGSVRDPGLLPNTDLTNAFTPG